MREELRKKLKIRTLSEFAGRPKDGYLFFLWYGVIGMRPKLAALVAEAIAICSHIDASLIEIVAERCDSDPEMLADIWAEFKNSGLQDRVIRAAARHSLPEEDALLVEKTVNTLVSPNREVRNDFAHHVWMATHQLPDALLLIEPAFFGPETVRQLVAGRKWLEEHERNPLRMDMPEQPYAFPDSQTGHDKILVFKEREIRRVIAASREVNDAVGLLYRALDRRDSSSGRARTTLLRRLEKRPPQRKSSARPPHSRSHP